MKFHICKITFEYEKDSQILKVMKKNKKTEWGDAIIQELNEELYRVGNKKSCYLIISDANFGEFELSILENILDKIDFAYIEEFFNECISKKYKLENVQVKSLQETTAKIAGPLIQKADGMSYIRFYRTNFIFSDVSSDAVDFKYYEDPDFKIEEKILNDEKISREQALEQADKIMVDNNFKEELERIYCKKNSQKFLGHPVHYKLTVKNEQGGKQIAEFLCQMLYANNRLVSRRITFISEFKECCYHGEINTIFTQSMGSTLIINLCGSKTDEETNYATAYEKVIEFFVKSVIKYQRNTLFIFIETTENPGFSTNFIKTLQEEIYLVELKESSGTYEQAFNYLKELVAEGNLTEYGDEDIHRVLSGKNLFTPSDVSKAYENLHRDYLRNNSYSAYKNVSRLLMKKNSIYGNRAYEVLNDMIGLTEIKNLVKQIIYNAKVQKMRAILDLDSQTPTMHMVFTGNPGTAKTTVAEILAHLLSKEGVLETGEFVECGRADLVGKYVGWTAPAVKKQFKMAKGGILFIDEAYSLIDDKESSFGDEAISTIVQEMENYRHDVIVIFAGYPDKMKNFLERNEGLRSRIAFQLDFPDYDADELTEILKFMAKYRDLKISEEVEEKCRKIFMKACNKPNFGNGRFVRNLLEQALLKQSQRLMEEYDGEIIDREKLIELRPEDFNVNLVGQYGANSRSIGFIK